MISTLSDYGLKPLTVGWWRGRAYVHIWDWRQGRMTWRPFTTGRTEPSTKPSRDSIFSVPISFYGRLLK